MTGYFVIRHDLEFSSKKPEERVVLEKWRTYLDLLSEAPQDMQDPQFQAKLLTLA
jgi:hypothetical protein